MNKIKYYLKSNFRYLLALILEPSVYYCIYSSVGLIITLFGMVLIIGSERYVFGISQIIIGSIQCILGIAGYMVAKANERSSKIFGMVMESFANLVSLVTKSTTH